MMEVLSFLPTSVPGYFVLGPLLILFLVLFVLLVKKSAPAQLPSSSGNAQVPPPQSIPPQNQSVPQTSAAAAISPQTPPHPPVQVTSTPPLSSQMSAHVNVQPVTTPQGVVPPVSSWKPLAPVSTSEVAGQSEQQMQADAVKEEAHQTTQAPIPTPSPSPAPVTTMPVTTQSQELPKEVATPQEQIAK